MLAELYIRNFAIIEELRLPIAPGFNVLTGETGAGKSIILDAVMLILGERADKTMVRAGAPIAYIEAIFALTDDLRRHIDPVLEAEGLESETPYELHLAREVRSGGRTVSRINGRSVNTRLLQQIGDYLIDIHGQGSHLRLLNPRSHLPLLDSYAGLEQEQRWFADGVAELRALRNELYELQQDEREIAQRIDLLTYQVSEIDAATLMPAENDELHAERKRLGNAEQLMQLSAEASAILLGVDDDTKSVSDLVNEVERKLIGLARLDDSMEPLLERMQGIAFELNEVAAEVDTYQESLEFNPERLSAVEERIELIHSLKRKYGDTIEDILIYRDRRAAELQRFEHSGERIEELKKEIDKRLRELGRQAHELSQKRREAAVELSNAIVHELADLRMDARFSVDFQQRSDDDGVYVTDERLGFDGSGIDRVEFLLSTNPGEPVKPMAKVASGGETARIMLALKTALAAVDDTPTLIFDEVDQGIGGRIGETVGRKLWGLTAVGGHQVIVVTHLPQLAGFGDRHFHVSKQFEGGRTRTHVAQLEHDRRVQELAAMLGTDSHHARGGAASILDNAARVKEQQLVADAAN